VEPAASPARSNRRPLLGLLGIAFYAAHAGLRVAEGHPENLLWACHLGCLATGLGLLLGRPGLNGVGLLWLVLGVPLWIYDLATNWEFQPTSHLTHVGGLLLALLGLRAMGLSEPVWWKAFLGLLLLHSLCRGVTPAESNVNLAHAIWPGWEPYFPSHTVYVALLAAFCLGLFVGVERVARRIGGGPAGPPGPR
jgi:hypothetical protein